MTGLRHTATPIALRQPFGRHPRARPIPRWLWRTQRPFPWPYRHAAASGSRPGLLRTGLLISELGSRSRAAQAREIGDLLHLHADADDRLARQRGRHDRSDASMNDGEIGHLIDLKRRNPVRDEDVRRNTDARNLGELKLHRSDHAVWLAFEAFNDPGDDLWCARSFPSQSRSAACPAEWLRVPRASGIRPAE